MSSDRFRCKVYLQNRGRNATCDGLVTFATNVINVSLEILGIMNVVASLDISSDLVLDMMIPRGVQSKHLGASANPCFTFMLWPYCTVSTMGFSHDPSELQGCPSTITIRFWS